MTVRHQSFAMNALESSIPSTKRQHHKDIGNIETIKVIKTRTVPLSYHIYQEDSRDDEEIIHSPVRFIRHDYEIQNSQEDEEEEENTDTTADLNTLTQQDLQGNDGEYFQADSGRVPHGLSWRSDPKLSFSDWILEVIVVKNGEEKSRYIYHTHSNVIVWGPRRGEFFVQLFHKRMNQIPPASRSSIIVLPTEAEIFPLLLDFMYCENSLPLSAERACSLYAMADKFVIPLLQKAVQSFVEKSLTLPQMIEFIEYAQYKSEYTKEIENLVICAVSKLCGYLVKHPSDAKHVKPDLLLHTLERRAKFMKKLKGDDPRTFSGEWEAERSKLLSRVVAECCFAVTNNEDKNGSKRTSYEDLSLSQFEQLVSHLPALDNHAALMLLQVDHKLTISNKSNNLTEFEEKCVSIIAKEWRDRISVGDRNRMDKLTKILRDLSPHVLSDLLVRISMQYELEIIIASEYAITSQHDILSQQQSRAGSKRSLPKVVDSKVKANYERFCSEMTNAYELFDDNKK